MMMIRSEMDVLRISICLLVAIKRMVSMSAFHLVCSPTLRAGSSKVVMTPTTPTTVITTECKSHLHMVKQKKIKSSNRGGLGFNSSASTVTDKNNSRTRSISSKHTGAGSKALASAANTFDRIRKLHGKEGTIDVYVRSPKNDESVFWFVGKVIRVLENNVESKEDDNNLTGSVYPTISETVLSQKRLILEYAKSELRPQNMGLPQYAPYLELWTAPGDSEMDVARNHVTLVKINGSSKDLREGLNINDVGYNPEIYVGEEKEKGGFRVVRDLEGRPVKPVFDISV